MTLSTKHNTNTAITKNICSVSPMDNEGCYKLSILRQHSLEMESFVENGRQKCVHYVIKNSAFVIEVALRKIDRAGATNIAHRPNEQDLDFKKVTLEAALLYDCEEDKPVMKVRSRPLTTRGLISPTNPNLYKLETTIEVLSSQHEDMNFKIKLFAIDIATGKLLEHITPVYSAPIQVISKPDVLVKKKQRSKKAPRKQTKQDQILEILSRMEAKQTNQQSQIDHLLAVQANQTNNAPSSRPVPSFHDVSSSFEQYTPSKRSFSTMSGSSNDCRRQTPSLEDSYFQFLAAYNDVKRHERPSKLRKLFANTAPSDLANFSEAASFLQSQQYFSNSQNVDISTFDFPPSMSTDTPNLDQLFGDLS